MDVEPFFRDLEITPRSFAVGLREALACSRSDPLAGEAQLLMEYAYAPGARPWRPGERPVELYRRALEVHGVDGEHRLDNVIGRHPILLGPLDSLSRIVWPRCVLQQKLAIAGSLVECHPASAEWLLPRDRSLVGLFWRCGVLGLKSASKLLAALPLLLWPGFVRRNAGTS